MEQVYRIRALLSRGCTTDCRTGILDCAGTDTVRYAADIFDDKALNKLIDKRPKTLDALGEMLDKNKIKDFGEELILVINS